MPIVMHRVLLIVVMSVYVCRLSDLLFTLARLAAQREGQEEKIYRRINPAKPP